jgi:hypothetical protein
MSRTLPGLIVVLGLSVGSGCVEVTVEAASDNTTGAEASAERESSTDRGVSEGADRDAASMPDETHDETNPVGANAACYVCHMLFVKEAISKDHLKAGVGCIKCHGLSAGHANDEDVGATPPDVVFARDQVDPMCCECHQAHDVAPEEVVARFLERALPAGSKPVCTDCHGHHRIESALEEAEAAEGPSA